MFDLIMFDLDGTLTDPKEGITNCVKYALESFGIHENDERVLMKFIGPPLVDSFEELYGFSPEDANRAVEKYRERFSSIGIFENAVFDGVPEMLTKLKIKGKKIALATSKPHIFAERILEKFKLLKYFDYTVGSELDGTRNYKDEVINEVLGLASTDKSNAVMVGDRKHDILGAKKCGVTSIGVRVGYAEPGELEAAGADYIFDTIAELSDFLQK
ncbi:MAG: HAD-IA family hydrolase [Firmicutes bacterium]|nr:HAD-IA family hydrolase [Bacillota bacterium]